MTKTMVEHIKVVALVYFIAVVKGSMIRQHFSFSSFKYILMFLYDLKTIFLISQVIEMKDCMRTGLLNY